MGALGTLQALAVLLFLLRVKAPPEGAGSVVQDLVDGSLQVWVEVRVPADRAGARSMRLWTRDWGVRLMWDGETSGQRRWVTVL